MKCKICKIRKVTIREWKTKEENETCLTCFSFMKYTQDMINALESMGKDKKISLKIIVRYG